MGADLSSLVAIGLLIFYSTASFVSAVYYRLCLKKHTGHVDASVALILPLTGRRDSFQKLLGLLEQQTLRPKRLIVAIESDTDPAYPFALSLALSVSFPVSVVIAGLAEVQLRMQDLTGGELSSEKWYIFSWINLMSGKDVITEGKLAYGAGSLRQWCCA